jgi:hypothetical protein
VPTFAYAVLDPPPAREGNYDHSWYVIMVGKEVGVFCGWYVTCQNPNLIFDAYRFSRSNAAPHVLGVPGAYYKPAADQSTAQAMYNSAFAAREVSVVL